MKRHVILMWATPLAAILAASLAVSIWLASGGSAIGIA